jgi:hypothetical protein
MPLADRAAQFSPFAALTGHDAAIRETARLTEARVELDENAKAVLDEKLHILLGRLDDRPEVCITYFQPDEKKEGGAYVTAVGFIKRVDDLERVLLMTDGRTIPLDDVVEMDSALFRALL